MCADEKSTQLLAHSQAPLPMHPGAVSKQDYEYGRGGTRNLFVAVEPRAGRRTVLVTQRRTKVDFVEFTRHLVETVYRKAPRIHLVQDTLRRGVRAWERRRNAQHRTIEWTFTCQDADRKLGAHYVS